MEQTQNSRQRFGCGFCGSTLVGEQKSTKRVLKEEQLAKQHGETTESASNPFAGRTCYVQGAQIWVKFEESRHADCTESLLASDALISFVGGSGSNSF